MDRLQELVRLHRIGTGDREVARLLRLGTNVERRYRRALQAAGLLEGPPDALPDLETLRAALGPAQPPRLPQQLSSVEAWLPEIGALREQGRGPRAILDRLRLEVANFPGTLSAIKRACLRIDRARGVRPEDVAIPVETHAGEVAQVDFGEVGRLFDPVTRTLRRAWVFLMVLGFSRHLVARIVFDQRVETWLRLHVEAFAELGGVVETIVPDNLKAAVVRAAFGIDGSAALHRSYRELAQHYGFKVDPTPIYQPRKKGKVESAVHYAKSNFFAGRAGSDVEEVRAALARWVTEIAGTRTHGTTGQRPLEVFESVERAALQPLPQTPYEPVVWASATVHSDSHIAFDQRLYSVPWTLLGQSVWVRATATSVVVYADDARVATHARRGSTQRSTVEAHLPAQRAPLRHRSRAYWEERADRLGAEVGAYVRAVFDSDDVLSLLRPVQAIVLHLEGVTPERAAAACRRAHHYGNFTYGGLKAILRRGLDLQPLPSAAATPPRAPATTPAWPRFARDLRTLLPH